MPKVLIKSIIIVLFIIASNAIASDRVLWEQGTNQNISIQTANISDTSHPNVIDSQTLKSLLTNLHVLNRKTDETKAVFNDKQVTVLAKYVARGLSELNTNQAIYFSISKDKSSMGGLIKSEVFTAGVMFNSDKGLAIIIGDHERERDYSYDAVFDPNKKGLVKYDFDYGLSKSKSDKIALTLNPEKVSKNAFMANDNQLIIPSSMLNTLVETQIKNNASTAYPEALKTVSRDEVQKMIEEKPSLSKQEIQEIIRETKDEQTKIEAPSTPKVISNTIEERFLILENLKSKGLITEQEYQQKRQELLSEL